MEGKRLRRTQQNKPDKPDKLNKLNEAWQASEGKSSGRVRQEIETMQICKNTRVAATLFIAIVMIVMPGIALAVPNLQIYIPGATYNAVTETWTIYSYDYELWVVGSNLDIYDVKFAAAVPMDENGSIDVTWVQGQLFDNNDPVNPTLLKASGYQELLSETANYSEDPYISFSDGTPTISFTELGTPTMGDGSELPPHGVFPTSYYEYYIGEFGLTTGDPEVMNYIPGVEYGDIPAKGGEVKKFDISVSGYTWVDIVAYDHYIKANQKAQYIFSPFSHDGGSGVPEPATLILLGSGLVGLSWIGRRKIKKILPASPAP